MRQTAFPFLHILGDLVASEVTNQFGGCRLCWSASLQGRRFAENTLLVETDDFIVTPALGSLNRESLLLIAKTHIKPLGTWSKERAESAEEQLEEVINILEPIAPGWLAFEHGASRQCQTRSCCIDHFHMHLVPMDQPSAERLVASLPTGFTAKSIRSQRSPKPSTDLAIPTSQFACLMAASTFHSRRRFPPNSSGNNWRSSMTSERNGTGDRIHAKS